MPWAIRTMQGRPRRSRRPGRASRPATSTVMSWIWRTGGAGACTARTSGTTDASRTDGVERGGPSERDCVSMVLTMAHRLATCGFPQVFAGRGTGSYRYHEVAAFVPSTAARTWGRWAAKWASATTGTSQGNRRRKTVGRTAPWISRRWPGPLRQRSRRYLGGANHHAFWNHRMMPYRGGDGDPCLPPLWMHARSVFHDAHSDGSDRSDSLASRKLRAWFSGPPRPIPSRTGVWLEDWRRPGALDQGRIRRCPHAVTPGAPPAAPRWIRVSPYPVRTCTVACAPSGVRAQACDVRRLGLSCGVEQAASSWGARLHPPLSAGGPGGVGDVSWVQGGSGAEDGGRSHPVARRRPGNARVDLQAQHHLSDERGGVP